jgi:ribonuclease T1
MLSVLRVFWLVCLLCLQACQPESVESHEALVQGQAGLHEIALVNLPPEVRETLRAIRQGGPFDYPRDGVVFGNFERILPRQPRGYYHEYTVKTPGVHSRGARRIVAGRPGEYYYSADHYQTFKRIRE